MAEIIRVEGDRPLQEMSWIISLLLVALTFAFYLPALGAGYIWDDNDFVTNNAVLTEGWRGLWKLWFQLGATNQYYPMAYTSFWLEYQVWGFNPFGSHFINVALHSVDALLLRKSLRVLEMPGATLAAFIFALHPVEVESVAWITERKNVLSTMFYLCAFLSYWGFLVAPKTPESPNQRPKFYTALLFYLCALCAKSVTCSFPAAVLILCWWKKDRVRTGDVMPLLPFFILGLGYGLVTSTMERHFVGAMGQDWHLTPPDRFLIAGRALWFYASKLIWPTNLIFFYPRWTPDAGEWWQWLFPAAALILAGLGWCFRARWGKGPAAAVLFYALTLFPALGFIDVYPFRFSFVADHFQYLAGMGLIALFAASVQMVLEKWPQPLWLKWILGGLLATVLGALTWRRCETYHDLETFYRSILEKNPRAWIAHENLAVTLLQKGAVDESLTQSEAALALKPDDANAEVNLGNSLAQEGRLAEAIDCYQAGLRIGLPELAVAHNDLGNVLFMQGKLEPAMEEYQRALSPRADYPEALNNLGFVLLKEDEPGQAIPYFTKALALRPDYSQAQANLEEAQLALAMKSKP